LLCLAWELCKYVDAGFAFISAVSTVSCSTARHGLTWQTRVWRGFPFYNILLHNC